MERRPLGITGLHVSALGLGAGRLGDASVAEEHAGALLNASLDAGITLIDTARSYGLSEERIGRHLASRRHEFVLVSKGGYGVEGTADWTAECVTGGIERALGVMRTDCIDVFLLHSCPQHVAMQSGLIEALDLAKKAGKIRTAGYSGEGEALLWAARSGHFGVLECSVNLFDQSCIRTVLPLARHLGIGVIAKRALGNAVWRHRECPAGDEATYWQRMVALSLQPAPFSWPELALRFSAFVPGVSSALVGTSGLEHLRSAVEACRAGALPDGTREAIARAFEREGHNWSGHV
jgi:aryl-alcohol dehydrogenase-like predicted oxidoreductase